MGFQYNGKLRAPELLIRGGGATAAAADSAPRVDLIRERETIPGLYANCLMPADLRRNLPASYRYAAGGSAAGSSGSVARAAGWPAFALPVALSAAVAAGVAVGVAVAKHK